MTEASALRKIQPYFHEEDLHKGIKRYGSFDQSTATCSTAATSSSYIDANSQSRPLSDHYLRYFHRLTEHALDLVERPDCIELVRYINGVIRMSMHFYKIQLELDSENAFFSHQRFEDEYMMRLGMLISLDKLLRTIDGVKDKDFIFDCTLESSGFYDRNINQYFNHGLESEKTNMEISLGYTVRDSLKVGIRQDIDLRNISPNPSPLSCSFQLLSCSDEGYSLIE